MADVFISYSREEREKARRFADGLAAHGYDVWFDAKLAAGASFDGEIGRELHDAKAVVVLWTPLSVRSRWVRSEAEIALQGDKLVQVLLDSGVNLPLPFDAVARIIGGTVEEKIDRAAAAIKKLTHQSAILPDPVRTAAADQPENRGFAFISYATEDTDFRDRLVSFLEAQNFAFWEYGSSDRDYEMLLFLELEKRIAEATMVLSVLSESWKSSVWCVKEYFFAKEARKPIFLLKAKELGPTLAIAGEHFIDFQTDEARGFDRLAREMKRKGL